MRKRKILKRRQETSKGQKTKSQGKFKEKSLSSYSTQFLVFSPHVWVGESNWKVFKGQGKVGYSWEDVSMEESTWGGKNLPHAWRLPPTPHMLRKGPRIV